MAKKKIEPVEPEKPPEAVFCKDCKQELTKSEALYASINGYRCDACNKKASALVVYQDLTVDAELWQQAYDFCNPAAAEGNRAPGYIQAGGHCLLPMGWSGDTIDMHVIVPEKMHVGPKLTYSQLCAANGCGPKHSNNHLLKIRGEGWVIQPNIIYRLHKKQAYVQIKMF